MPLLFDNDILGDAAMDAVKALLQIDIDSLWRGLLLATGNDIPDIPLLPLFTRKISTNYGPRSENEISKIKAEQLFKYISDLPELPCS